VISTCVEYALQLALNMANSSSILNCRALLNKEVRLHPLIHTLPTRNLSTRCWEEKNGAKNSAFS